MGFREKLKQRRLELGKTLENVAREVGVSSATVQRWESGAIKNLKQDKIAKLAKALDTTPEYLMGWTDNEECDQSRLSMYIQKLTAPGGQVTELEKQRIKKEQLLNELNAIDNKLASMTDVTIKHTGKGEHNIIAESLIVPLQNEVNELIQSIQKNWDSFFIEYNSLATQYTIQSSQLNKLSNEINEENSQIKSEAEKLNKKPDTVSISNPKNGGKKNEEEKNDPECPGSRDDTAEK